MVEQVGTMILFPSGLTPRCEQIFPHRCCFQPVRRIRQQCRPPSGDRHLGSSAETDDILFARLRGLVLSAFARHAARKTTPAGTSPVVTIRHSAISSFLARATIRVLRVLPRASAVRARYHCASALSF